MRTLTLVFFMSIFHLSISAQNATMTNDRLATIIQSMADSVGGQEGQWSFKIGEMWFVCFTDTNHDRMRIMTPIIDVAAMEAGEMERCLKANFHTALDVKYCIADDILWSAFIHPLGALKEDQVIDAVKQVFSASATFGTLYSSSELVFPGAQKEEKKKRVDRT